ncbi:MAG: four helix bundle protein [Lentimicrobiaceae bacterium]|nr:four helix bundle protein [Lentimicrobiaceae bacterium]
MAEFKIVGKRNLYHFSKLPLEEKYVISDLLRRAVISVPSNIAEGSARLSTKEQIRFYEIAFGSLMEVYCQLQLCIDVEYLISEDIKNSKKLIFTISKQLSKMRTFLQTKTK